MKIAYTSWMWLQGLEKRPEELRTMFRQSVRELSHLGYKYIENMACYLVPYFKDPRDVQQICEEFGTRFVALYSNLDEGYETLTSYVRFLKNANAEYLISMSPNWEYGRDIGSQQIDWEKIRKQTEIANQIGAYAADHGITFCFNPHAYTDVAGEQEFSYFAERTEAKYVKFCLDCGHATISGVEPISQLEQYYDRTAYIHIKDVDPTVPRIAPRFGRLSFTPLGFGTVNIKGYLLAMQARGYEGYVCVGMPPPCEKINQYESAAISRKYLWLNCGI